VKLNGGYACFLGLILLCFLIYSVLQTASSIFLSLWAEDSSNMRNLYIFIALTFSANLFIFLEAIVLLLSGVRQGREVHNNIVKGLLYASLTDFFNRVPVGRILNRLGKDLKELDESIAPNFSSFLISLFRILSAVFICIYTSTPYALIPIVLVAVVFIRVRIFYLKGQ
jgi:ATP-binding cassette, subfamily C (CFTR/MRP), member 1